MKLMAIDTSTEGCSAALLVDNEMTSRLAVEPRKHAELILPMLDELLSEAGLAINQLDAVAFGRGPGAFTGVRIATGVIQGIAFGADLPVVPVSTLRALAQRTFDEHQHHNVMAAFDARMQEVYWACYQADQQGIMLLAAEEQVLSPDLVHCEHLAMQQADQWVGAGSGWQAYPQQMQQALANQVTVMYPEIISRAQEIAKLAKYDFAQGLAVDAENALPVYLRNKVAWKKRAD